MPSNENLGSVDMYSPRRNAAILSLNFLFANPYWANALFTLIVFKVSIDSVWGILNFQNLGTSFWFPKQFFEILLGFVQCFLFPGFELIPIIDF